MIKNQKKNKQKVINWIDNILTNNSKFKQTQTLLNGNTNLLPLNFMIKFSIVLIALYKNARLKYGKTIKDININLLSIDPSIMVENNLSVSCLSWDKNERISNIEWCSIESQEISKISFFFKSKRL